MDFAKELSEINLEKITDIETRSIVVKLLAIIENLYQENQRLKKINQELKDEVNRLKGEQGKPNVRSNTKPIQGDISSEFERKQAESDREKIKARRKKEKKNKKAGRQQKCQLNKANLPPDLQFKGYERHIIPEIRIELEYVEFLREKYYSPSEKKTFLAPLPTGYSREFSPSVRALVIAMKYELNSTESAIRQFLTERGLSISSATLSRMLTDKLDLFHQEKREIFKNGLHSRTFIQADDTGARVKGKNQHAHIFCNNRFSAFFTKENKDRMTLVDILRMDRCREYVINSETIELLRHWKLPQKRLSRLISLQSKHVYNQQDFDQILRPIFTDKKPLLSYQKLTKSAAYIARYHLEDCITALVCDDAPQFKFIGQYLALCWIHEGRHYKKMCPIIPFHQKQLATFRGHFWTFYKTLLDYQDNPAEKDAESIRLKFDELCCFDTTYPELKDRINKTQANKAELLYVLKDPSVPLHNNESELGARKKVRDRDIRLHTMSDAGTQANDTFLTLRETARKQAVGFMEYIQDRLSGTNSMTSLADLVGEKQLVFSTA
jgi:Transposase IS66 family